MQAAQYCLLAPLKSPQPPCIIWRLSMTCTMSKYITALEDLSKSGCQDTAINSLSVNEENSFML